MTLSAQGKEELLPLVASGDRSAMRRCVDRYGGIVWSLARRMLRNNADAEDAVQEIFITLWQKAAMFDSNRASESTFIGTVARRRLIDRLRRRKTELKVESFEAAAEPSARDRQSPLETADEVAGAVAAMKQLSPDQRRVLELSIYSGMSHAEISEKTRTPLGTVKTHARRGLLRLRELLASKTPVSEEVGI